MANSLMNILSGIGGGNGGMLMQAFGAMLRGESPQAFLQGLANTRPELRGLDLTDINAAAHKVCRDHGVDEQKLTAEIRQKFQSL